MFKQHPCTVNKIRHIYGRILPIGEIDGIHIKINKKIKLN